MTYNNAKALLRESRLSIHEKIFIRGKACQCLTWTQYMQLVSLNKVVLAPYYRVLMRWQAEVVASNENFKQSYGKSRYEYENGI
jgi:hypothetical protein